MSNIRAWIPTAFLSANCAVALLPVTGSSGLRWPWFSAWVDHLNSEFDTSLGNAYSVALWVAVFVLAAAHLRRPPVGRRWLWKAGWTSFALLAAMTALLETDDWYRNQLDGTIPVDEIAPHFHWMILAAPLALPLIALAGYSLWAIVRRNPRLRILAAISVLLGFAAVARDSFFYLYDPTRSAWPLFLEDGSEIMSAAILVAILGGSLGRLPLFAGPVPWRRFLAAGSALSVVVAILALLPTYKYEWGSGSPDNYTGPIALIEQDIGVHHPYLSSISVWSYVKPGSADQAEILLRLTPLGQDRPSRESSAVVRNTDWNEKPVNFAFAPIPESRDQTYRLTIGVLGPPSAQVFLGLTGNDPIPDSSVTINGEPTRWANDLSFLGHWEGRGARVIVDAIRHTPSHLVLIIDLVLTALLCLLSVTLRPWRDGPLRHDLQGAI